MKKKKRKSTIFLERIRLIDKRWIVVALLLFFTIFLRSYQLENGYQFTWDQVDNAWAAKNIIVDHDFPLVGMVAKQNTGFYIGPLYYYFITPFYWIFQLDPIASSFIAIVSSIITFFVLFFCIKKIFSFNIALVALFIYSVSFYIVSADKTQWPINFITPISMLIFYCLYRILNNKEIYIIVLALFVGLSFHLNFTAVFFPLIVLLCIPFFPRTKKTLFYSIIAIPLFLVWFVPNLIYELKYKATGTRHMTNYINTYYHGIHLTRIMQLISDAFIEFEGVLTIRLLKFGEILLIPAFILIALKTFKTKQAKILGYLVCIWILVPWVVFSVYKGEISNYYFSLNRPIVLMVLSCILVFLFSRGHLVIKIAIILFGIYYTFLNIQLDLEPIYRPLSYRKQEVQEKMKRGEKIEFQQGMPESYIYYVYTRKK